MHENTYINDIESAGELARLDHQEKIVQAATNLLPTALLSKPLTRILDIGCGAGRWVLDMAFSYPDAEVAGIDISKTLVDYANARARSQKLTNASFGVVDVLKEFPFTPNSFDLIHLRFGAGWLPLDAWEPLFTRCKALLTRGGFLVTTEGEGMYTSSPALTRFHHLFCAAMHKAGRSPSHAASFMGFAAQLGYLLQRGGYTTIGGEASLLDYSSYHTTENYQWRDNFTMLLHEISPFLLKTGVTTPEELAEITIRATSEMFFPDFYGIGTLFTFYGEKGEERDDESV